MDQRINLGDVARDPITGFEGVVVCESRWLGSPDVRLTVQPRGLHDGRPIERETFDPGQLVLVVPAGMSDIRDEATWPAEVAVGPNPDFRPTVNVGESLVVTIEPTDRGAVVITITPAGSR